MHTAHLENLIAEGEHQQQDFKFRIDDSRKIARSLSAFANTDGGRLLVGVKDNGRIAGVRSDEEFHMVEAAAQLYTQPEVQFELRLWEVEKKSVLEIIIRKSTDRPHFAKDDKDQWKAYVRKDDQNIVANQVLQRVWKQKASRKGVGVAYTETEEKLFAHLRAEGSITFSKFCRMGQIHHKEAESILVKLICWDLIEMIISDKGYTYQLKREQK